MFHDLFCVINTENRNDTEDRNFWLRIFCGINLGKKDVSYHCFVILFFVESTSLWNIIVKALQLRKPQVIHKTADHFHIIGQIVWKYNKKHHVMQINCWPYLFLCKHTTTIKSHTGTTNCINYAKKLLTVSIVKRQDRNLKSCGETADPICYHANIGQKPQVVYKTMNLWYHADLVYSTDLLRTSDDVIYLETYTKWI